MSVTSGWSSVNSSRRLAIGNAPITPTDASVPSSLYRPSSSEPIASVTGLVHPVPGHHAVRGALVLDLEHHPLVRLVGDRQRLGDHPVEAGALELVEPALRGRRDRWSPA